MSSTNCRTFGSLAFALLFACAAVVPATNLTAATIPVTVGMHGTKFTPQTVTIQPGDTVQWTWDGNDHSSTSGTVGHPDGKWDSGVQNKGFVFSQTFPTAGNYPYYCTVHGSCCGMTGTITVAAPTGGAVFVNANATANQICMYTRGTDGQLTLLGTFPTQGTGGGKTGLSSQGSVALAMNNTYLYAVNAKSNDITAFQVSSTGLTFIGKVSSMGIFPTSLAVHGNLVYVLNSKGNQANISGYTIQSDGSLTPIPNSTLPLSSARPTPGQVGFTPDGTTLIVSEKTTDLFDTYSVGAGGVPTGPTPQNSSGSGPFGFAFDGLGTLVVSEITLSSASSYNVVDGVLEVVTARLKDKGKAACWAMCTNLPTLPQQYAYLSNTNSDSLSGYAVSSTGALSLLVRNGQTALLPTGAFPIDQAISSDNQYLYVLEKKLPGIGAFQIQSDGSLVQIQSVTGTPTSAYGMVGY